MELIFLNYGVLHACAKALGVEKKTKNERAIASKWLVHIWAAQGQAY